MGGSILNNYKFNNFPILYNFPLPRLTKCSNKHSNITNIITIQQPIRSHTSNIDITIADILNPPFLTISFIFYGFIEILLFDSSSRTISFAVLKYYRYWRSLLRHCEENIMENRVKIEIEGRRVFMCIC